MIIRKSFRYIHARRRELTEIALITLAFFVYFGVRGLVIERVAEAEQNALDLISAERWLGIYLEPSLQDLLLFDDWVSRFANAIYLYGHGPVLAIVAVLLYVRDRKTYLLARNTILLSGGIGLVIYYLYPVAPPRLTPDADLVDTVLREYNVRRVLMPNFLTNEYAAVPSLHFGWNLVMGVALWVAVPFLLARIFAVVMPLLMLIAIVVTANHYILDATAGMIVVIAGAILAFKLRDLGEMYFPEDNGLHEEARWLLGVFGPSQQRSACTKEPV